MKIVKYVKFSNWILYFTIFISIVTIIILFSNFTLQWFYVFFNSDTLYLPSIYKDLFSDHNTLKGWHLNPAPNIFPDMILYFIIMAVTSDFIVSSFFFAIIQYVCFIYLIFRLFKAINIPTVNLITSFSALLMLLFFMVAIYSDDFSFSFYLISNSYHTGAFLMSLFCSILSFEYLKFNKRGTIITLLIVSILCVFSDRLFIVLYNIPWIILMVFIHKIENSKRLIHVNIVNVVAIFAGITAFNLLGGSGYIKIGRPHRIMEYEYFSDSFRMLTDQMMIYLKDGNFKTVIIIISIVVFLHHALMTGFKLFGRKKFNLTETYFAMSVIFTIVVFFAPVLNGNYTGFDTLRYNIYVFYILVINSGILVYFFFKWRISNAWIIFNSLLVALLFTASLNIAIHYNSKGLKDYFTYYPDPVKRIDEISRSTQLRCGLGNYWNAKVITMFSKNNVRVYSAIKTIHPYLHVVNENWFLTDSFNFFVMDSEVKDSIINGIFDYKTRSISSGEVKLIITPEFGFNREFKIINPPEK